MKKDMVNKGILDFFHNLKKIKDWNADEADCLGLKMILYFTKYNILTKLTTELLSMIFVFNNYERSLLIRRNFISRHSVF